MAVVCSIACVEQWHGLGDAPGQGIRRAQGRSHRGEQELGCPRPGRGPWPVRARGVPWAGPLGGGTADQCRNRHCMRLRGASTASAIRSPSSPRALPSANCPARHGTRRARHGSARRAGDLTEALVSVAPFEGRHGLPEAVDRPTIVALGLVGLAEVAGSPAPAGRHLRWPWRGRGRAGRRRWRWSYVAHAARNSADRRARPVPADADRRGPRRGSRPHAGSRGCAQSRPDGKSAERRASRRSMACSRVSRCSGRCCEGAERLLEVPHGLAVGRARHGLLPRLPAVRQGLVPHLAPQGMVGQAFDLLGHPVRSERLRGPRRCGRGGPAAAPGAGCRRPPRASGHA